MKNFKKLTMYDENIETTTSNSTSPLLGLDNVSGSISIYEKDKSSRIRKISCTNKWFDNTEYCEFIGTDEFLLVKKCYLEIPKTAKKIPKSRVFDMVIDAPIGTFDIDEEESTEDELVVYYR